MLISATRFVIATVKATLSDRVFDMSAALAYYALLSLFPMLLVALAVAGQVLSPEAQERLIENLADALPASRDLIADNIRDIARSRGPVGGVAFVGLVWAGSNAFGATERMLNQVWHVRRARSLFIAHARRVAMGFVASAMLVASIGVSVLMQAATGVLGSSLVVLAGSVATAVITVGVFTLIYRYTPNARVTSRAALTGGVVGGLGFEVGKFAFAVYAGNYSNFALVYGALGGTIAFLVWIYWSCVFLFVGAEAASVARKRF